MFMNSLNRNPAACCVRGRNVRVEEAAGILFFFYPAVRFRLSYGFGAVLYFINVL